MASILVRKPLSLIAEEAGQEGEHCLKRSLGVLNLVALGIGAIVGAGIFVLTGSAAAQFAGSASAAQPAVSRIVAGTFYSQAMLTPRPFEIYLPPSYEQAPDRVYPVLYLLHGDGGRASDWAAFGLQATMDQAVAGGATAAHITSTVGCRPCRVRCAISRPKGTLTSSTIARDTAPSWSDQPTRWPMISPTG